MPDDASIPRIAVDPDSDDPRRPITLMDDADIKTIKLPTDDRRPDTARPPLSSHYAVVDKIGDGGMGVVYLARDKQLGRHVAIKRLNHAALKSPPLRKRFLQEAKTIAVLNHIHIVHVYALGEDEDGPYIVMEYVPGPAESSPGKTPPSPYNLADRVTREGPLPLNEAVDLGVKLCRAVEYAHSCGIIHRDLKPSNVLLDESGEPKIVDFGLARQMSSEYSKLTVPGEKMLSLGYGAPEQESDASTTDERADVYGLGALMYYSVTGQNPRYFRDNDLPEALRAPIVKALKTDREKRWSRVADLRTALTAIQAPSTVVVPTVKTSWRCKWCDTVNPVTIQFCGECGWDGREFCAECGAEMRIGIPFCGDCGANAREYEVATRLAERLRRYRAEKDFERVVQQAGALSGFKPVGPGGRKIVEDVQSLVDDARQALHRRQRLQKIVRRDVESAYYERALEHIEEYDTLATDDVFAAEKRTLPGRMLERDLGRARQALDNRRWDYAARTCTHVLRELDPNNDEALRMLAAVRRRHRLVRLELPAVAALVLFFFYLLSAAPAYRWHGPFEEGGFNDTFYRLADRTHERTLLRGALEWYAALWGAEALYEEAEPRPPESPSPAAGTKTSARLAALRGEFEQELQQLNAEHARKLNAWPAEYVKGLRELQKEMQRRGDFEGWKAAKEEVGRFQTDWTIEDADLVLFPERLRQVQERYRKLIDQYDAELHRAVVALSRQHQKRLAPLQKRLTMEGKMDEALEVNNEIKWIKSLPDVAAAEAAVAEMEAAAAAARTEEANR